MEDSYLYLSRLADPLSIVPAFLVVLLSPRKYIIAVAALLAASLVETARWYFHYYEAWGAGYLASLAIGFIHAGLVFWLLQGWRSRRRSAERPDKG